MELASDNFELFECNIPCVQIGVKVQPFNKLFSAVETNETVTLSIAEEDFNEGNIAHFTVEFENSKLKRTIAHYLNLTEPDGSGVYPEVSYSTVVEMPSLDFSKVVRSLSNCSNYMGIVSSNKAILFHAISPTNSSEIRYCHGDKIRIDERKVEAIQGVFSMVKMRDFIRCSSLSPTVQLHLANHMPLVIQYDVSNLGIIRLCLAGKD